MKQFIQNHKRRNRNLRKRELSDPYDQHCDAYYAGTAAEKGEKWEGRTIENNFLILKIEKRNKIIVFDLFLSNPKQNKTKQAATKCSKQRLRFTSQ